MLYGDAVEPNELETVGDTETAAGRQSLLLRDDQRQRDVERGDALWLSLRGKTSIPPDARLGRRGDSFRDTAIRESVAGLIPARTRMRVSAQVASGHLLFANSGSVRVASWCVRSAERHTCFHETEAVSRAG